MTDARTDLTGRWTGVYFYPVHPEWNPDDDLPPTPFTAELFDAAGLVTGSTEEPDVFGEPDAPPIPATLEGHHFDGELTFTKFPDGGGQIHSIDYIGTISADGNSVAGRWIIHGEWSGTFQMQRKVLASVVSSELSATV
jgi:hypothetical protein